MSTTLDIAVAADDRAALPLAVTLAGVDRHLAEDAVADVRVVTTRMTGPVRDRLREAAEGWPQTRLSFVDVVADRLAELPEVGHLTRETYLRLLLPELLGTLESVLYLDADLLVQRDLSPLATFDLTGAPLAAVPDAAAPLVGENDGLSFCFEDAVRPSVSARTINAGVLIFDLTAWRERHLADRLIAFLAEHAEHLRWADQDALNAELGHEIAHLPLAYNVMSLWKTHPPLREDEQERVKTWLADPATAEVVWHFAGRNKPWKPQSFRSRFRRVYHDALEDSGWFESAAAFKMWQATWAVRNVARAVKDVAV
ncbi:MAG: glycosyltransferase [Planctomycetota bacterium]